MHQEPGFLGLRIRPTTVPIAWGNISGPPQYIYLWPEILSFCCSSNRFLFGLSSKKSLGRSTKWTEWCLRFPRQCLGVRWGMVAQGRRQSRRLGSQVLVHPQGSEFSCFIEVRMLGNILLPLNENQYQLHVVTDFLKIESFWGNLKHRSGRLKCEFTQED